MSLKDGDSTIIVKGNGDKKKKIWSVYSNDFDVGEINSYLITFDEAVKMCHTAFLEGEGTVFTIMDKDYKGD